jgi:nicotinamidase-related amidase
MPWLPRVPNVAAIASAHPERTIFTRFILAGKPGQGVGMWRHYYERWGSMTIDQLGPEMIGLVADLAQFVPPARTFDKHVYSPWTGTDLHQQLRGAGVEPAARPMSACSRPCLARLAGASDSDRRAVQLSMKPTTQ